MSHLPICRWHPAGRDTVVGLAESALKGIERHGAGAEVFKIHAAERCGRRIIDSVHVRFALVDVQQTGYYLAFAMMSADVIQCCPTIIDTVILADLS